MQRWIIFPPLLVKLSQMGEKGMLLHLASSYLIGSRADSYGCAELAASVKGPDLAIAEQSIFTQNKRMANEPKDLHSSQ